SRVGYYKNYFEECGNPGDKGPLTNPPDSLEYAATDKACREGYRNQVHVYPFDVAFACKTCDNAPLVECGRNEDCPVGGTCTLPPVAGSANASCYRPRIMIQDNWGWCTNGVYGEVGFGCYDTTAFQLCGGVVAGGPCESDAECSGGVACVPVRPPSPTTPNDGFVQFQGLIKVYKDPKP
ncbi:MAG: hypothetical protein AAB490_05720, partial [Patescibacteria group bacterium]